MARAPGFDADFREMRDEGLSYSQIAARLHITKNAAIGLGRRLGIARAERAEREATGERPGRWLLPPPRKAVVPASGASLTAPAPVSVFRVPQPPVACQWPSGGSGRQVRFCDAPVVKDKPYCAAHCRVAFTRWAPVAGEVHDCQPA
jgi:hypothetical protein